MGETKENYNYTVVNGESLVSIAEKHDLQPAIAWARKIWLDEKNASLHKTGKMNGKNVKRQIHLGNDRYEDYDHSKFAAGYRGYELPNQIILYSGEKLWIPEVSRILHFVTDEEILKGFTPEYGKKYELIFPAIRVRFDKEYKSYDDGDKYTLSGYDENKREIYKKTLTVGSDKIEKDGVTQIIFRATPRSLKYAMTAERKAGSKKETVKFYEGKTYEECSVLM